MLRLSNEQTNHTKPLHLARTFLLGLFSCCLSGCSNQTFWNDSYNLRQWERAFLNGESFDLSRKYEQSRNNYSDALGFAEKLPANSMRLTDTLLRLGNADAKLNDSETATTAYKRAIDVLRADLQTKPLGADAFAERENLAYSRSRLGTLYERCGKFDDAKKELAESISLYQQLGVERDDSKLDKLSKRDYATTLGAALFAEVELNHEADAKKLYARISAPGLLTAFTPSLVNSINRKYASMLTKLGHTQEADDILAAERCRAQCKLGFDALRSGDLAAAEKSYTTALEMAARTNNSVMLSIANQGLGDVYNSQGKLKEAQKCFKTAVDEWSLTDSKPNHGLDGLLQSLASVSVFERWDISAPILERWIKLRQDLYGINDERVAQPLLLAALICDYQHHSQKDPDYARQKAKILDFANKAFDISIKANVKERIDATGIEALADLFFCLNENAKAEQLYNHLIERNKFYGRGAGFSDAQLLFKISASESSADGAKGTAGVAAQDRAMQIIRSIKRPLGVYLVAKSLAYLSHDLTVHSDYFPAGIVVDDIRNLIARVQPANIRDRRFRAIADAAIASYDKRSDSHLSRIVFRPEPGSFEANLTTKMPN